MLLVWQGKRGALLEPDEAILKQVVRDGSQSKSYL